MLFYWLNSLHESMFFLLRFWMPFWDGGFVHCCCPSKNTCAWGNRLACSHHGRHDDLCSSFRCCLSKSKNGIVSKKETLTGSNSFFPDEVSALNKEEWSLYMTLSFFFLKWLHLQSSFFCKIFSCSPSLCDKSDHGIDCLSGDYGVGICCNCAGRVDGSCNSCNNDASGFWVMAVSGGKMSFLLFLWLFLLLELVLDTGCFIRSLTLLKKGN